MYKIALEMERKVGKLREIFFAFEFALTSIMHKSGKIYFTCLKNKKS